MRSQNNDFIEPNQEWQVDLFRPGDAPGVARLFRLVYGDGYPIKTFLEPERLIAENAARRTISNVVRTPKGDIVGHCALVQSAPFQGLYEISSGLVAPDYRREKLGFRLFEHISTIVAPLFSIDSLFGEPVCNNIVMQKIGAQMEFKVSALEADLMPAEVYSKEESAAGRVATLLFFKITSPQPQTIYVPPAYEELVRFIYGGIKHECLFVPSSGALPQGQETVVSAQLFDFAKVARFAVHAAGSDFTAVFDAEEKAALQQGAIVHQVWLQLAWPWVGQMVDLLRSRGYFVGGVLPRWFDVDGFLMQKIFGAPHWDGIQVFGERAGHILQLVQADWDETQQRSRDA